MQKQKTNPENIDLEKERLIKYMSLSEKDLNDLISFLDEIYLNCSNFSKLTTKKLSSFFDESQVSNVITKIDQNIKLFYQNSTIFFNKLIDIMEKFNLIIILPLKEFKDNYIKENLKTKEELTSIINDYKFHKKKLSSYQKKYYLSVSAYYSDKTDIKNKWEFKNNRQLYKYQVGNTNIIYRSLDLRYKKYYNLFEKKEGNKLSFLSNIFCMFSNQMNDLSKSITELSTEINFKFSGWKSAEDKDIIKEEFNYIGKNITSDSDNNHTVQRFNKEIFVQYDLNNFQNITENGQNLDNNEDCLNNDCVLNFNFIKNKDYQNQIIIQFFECLDSSNEIPFNLISYINEFVNYDKEFSVNFFKYFFNKHKNNYLRLFNVNNIKHLRNILFNILISGQKIEDIEYKYNKNSVILSIINIGQRVYYMSSHRDLVKTFLCGLLKKYYLFQSENFWEEMIHFKLKNNINAALQEKSDKKLKNKNKEENELSSKNISDKNKCLKMFINLTESSNSENIKAPISEDINKLSYNEKDTNDFLNKCFRQFHNTILEFIPSLINYNFGLNKSIEFIYNVCSKYSLSSNIINYYLSSLEVNSYSIKQYSRESNYKIKKLIREIKNTKKIPKKNVSNAKKIFTETEKIEIILCLTKFLTNNEKIYILKLNKNIYNKIQKKLYREILITSDKKLGISKNKKTHIDIWKILLNYKEIKKKFPYESNKKKALSKKYENAANNDFGIIDLDCQRTQFNVLSNYIHRSYSQINYANSNGNNTNYNSSNSNSNNINDNENHYQQKVIEEKRLMLNNILKTAVMLNSESNYYQGMNFVGAFFLKLNGNKEEDTFYLLLSIFKNTQYKNIFLNNLSGLGLYFNVFEKILFLFIPTLYLYFKNHKILPDYYLSSWFITLFTNYANKQANIDVFIKIFDMFIMDGWKGIFNLVIEILRHNEDALLNMKNENLLGFLNNNLMDDFLLNYRLYSCFNLNYVNMITEKLMISIDNQFNQSLNLNIVSN